MGATRASRLVTIDLTTGETLAEARAQLAPTQAYDVLLRLQQVAVSVGGERLLYQDAQGLVDAGLAGWTEAIALSIRPRNVPVEAICARDYLFVRFRAQFRSCASAAHLSPLASSSMKTGSLKVSLVWP